MRNPADPQLLLPLNALSLTEGCILYLEKENIHSLKDFIQAGWTAQKNSPSFNILYFNEAVSLLDDMGLLHLMERGNSN